MLVNLIHLMLLWSIWMGILSIDPPFIYYYKDSIAYPPILVHYIIFIKLNF